MGIVRTPLPGLARVACSTESASPPGAVQDAADANDTTVAATDGGEVGDARTVDADAVLAAEVDGARALPDRLYGVTIDGDDPLPSIVDSLAKLSHAPITRIVFDPPPRTAASYLPAVTKVRDVGYVMGLIVDSSDVKLYSVGEYRARVTSYLDTLGDKVDLWEIGNEVNGDPWLGPTADVVVKITDAYDQVKKRGMRTALTLYYNDACFSSADHEMFSWTEKNIPASMKAGLDYVLVSFYEEDCPATPKPDWTAVFGKLAVMFPKAKLGMDECGTKVVANKAALVKQYYSMKLAEPRFVGGFFWWYFRQDMVPATQPLWDVLNTIIK